MQINNYKGLKIGKEKAEPVTKEQVEIEIKKLLERATTFKEKEGKSNNGDIVNIDFEGFVDGVSFEGGKGEKYDLELGSNTFIPGFEDQLVGFAKGDEVDVNVTFPEAYPAENLKGKPALFKCKVHLVKEKVVPELNDDFAKQFGLENVEALRNQIENSMNMENTDKKMGEYLQKVYDSIVSSSTIDIEDEKIENRLNEMVAYYDKAMGQYGTNLEGYLQMTGLTMEAFKEQIKLEAVKSLQIDAVTDEIAKIENLLASEEEFEEVANNYARYYSFNEEQTKQFKETRKDELLKEITRQKVSQFLVLNND